MKPSQNLLCELLIQKKLQKDFTLNYLLQNVNDTLTSEVDDLQEHQRRQCIVIDGLQTARNETVSQATQKAENVFPQHLKLDPDEVVNQIDKCHRIRPFQDDSTQSAIVRFKLHSSREKVYVNRRKFSNRNITIKLSVTRKRRKTLTYTKKFLDKLPNVKFYVDIHGKLKLRLNEPINNKKFYPFRDKRKLFNLSRNLNGILTAENQKTKSMMVCIDKAW